MLLPLHRLGPCSDQGRHLGLGPVDVEVRAQLRVQALLIPDKHAAPLVRTPRLNRQETGIDAHLFS